MKDVVLPVPLTEPPNCRSSSVELSSTRDAVHLPVTPPAGLKPFPQPSRTPRERQTTLVRIGILQRMECHLGCPFGQSNRYALQTRKPASPGTRVSAFTTIRSPRTRPEIVNRSPSTIVIRPPALVTTPVSAKVGESESAMGANCTV